MLSSALLWGEICGAAAQASEGEEPMLVTAPRREPPPGVAWNLLRPGEGRYWPGLSLMEMLARSPGVQVTRTGGRGGLASLYLRGGGSGDTLFLLDGVPLNDPSVAGGGLDLAFLDAAGLREISLLRGPGAALRGRSGLGGAVLLHGARGAGDPEGYAVLDSLGGRRWSFGFGLGGERAALRIGLGLDGARDYAADPAAGHGERDRHRQQVLHLGSSLRLASGLELEGTLRYFGSRSAYDDYVFTAVDDADARQWRRRVLVGLRLRHRPSGSFWRQAWRLWYLRSDSRYENGPEDLDAFEPLVSRSRGRREGAAWRLEWRPAAGRGVQLELDAERQRLSGAAGARELRYRAHLGGQWKLDGRGTAAVGMQFLRLVHGRPAWAWQSSLELETPLPGLRLLAAAGRSLKEPDLFSLYSPTYGNPELRPERGWGWEGGLGYRRPSLEAEARFYSRRLRDRLGFMNNRYLNVKRERLRGVEANFTLRPVPGLELYADYALSRAFDSSGELARRGYARVNAGLRRRRGILDLGAHLRHEWRRRGLSGPLPSYTLLGLFAGWQLHPRLQLFVRTENLLDKDYREVPGYWSPGLAVYGGLRLQAGGR